MLRFDERVHLPKNRENTITFLVNGEPIGTVETLAPGAKTVDIPVPTIDYDSVTDALGYVPQEVLVSGSNIKTINNISLLGSGNVDIQGGSSYTAGNGIDITNDVISIDNTVALKSDIPTIPEEVFIAEYGRTTYQDVLDAYNAGKAIYAKRQVTSGTSEIFSLCSKQPNTFWFANAGGIDSQRAFILPQTTVYTLDARDIWDISTFTNASNTLSNVVAIDASSAVQTALDDKVSKAGDTMTGGLQINKSTTDETGNYYINLSGIEYDDVVSTNIYPHILTVTDANNDVIGDIEYAQHTNGNKWISLQAHNVTSNTYSVLKAGFDSNGDAYCEFPDTKRVDGQWTFKSTELANAVAWNSTSHSDPKNYSLSNYLPNNSYKYEVILRANATTTSTSGKFIRVGVTSDIITTQAYACACRTRTASSQTCAGSIILPVGTGRKISVAGTSDSSSDGTYGIRVLGYRRIGLNA